MLNPSIKTDSFFGKLKNYGLKLLGGTVQKTLSYCDEIVLSYVFVRSRLYELYGNEKESEDKPRPGRKKSEEGKKKETIKILFEYAVDGICLYVKNCLPLLKSSFVLILQVMVFGWIMSIISGVIVFSFLSSGIIKSFIIFVIIRVAYSIISYTFIEPYETIALVSEFYNVMYEDVGDLNLDAVKDKLLNFSVPFRKMVSKAMGREEAKVDENVSKPSGSIIDDDLIKTAGAVFGSAFHDDKSDDDQLNQNISSLEEKDKNNK